MNVTRFLNRFGREAIVTCAGGETVLVKAVVTPLRYKNKMYLEGEYSPAGYVNGGHSLLIARYFTGEVIPGCAVTVSGARYVVKKWEVLYLGEAPLFVWGVVQQAAKEGAYGVL